MNKTLFLSALLLLAPAAANAAKHEAKVPIDDARKTALAKVPGKIKAEELEREHKRWIYSFEIDADATPAEKKGKEIQEVNVDADTGEIVGVETEKE